MRGWFEASVLASALVAVTWPCESLAARRCGARANPKTGAIEVKATGITGSPRWGAVPGGATAAFADETSCLRRGRLQSCRLGAAGSLALVTAPESCQVCVSDGGAESCCAFVRGCTPGVRVADASFPAGDPRFADADSLSGIWQRASGTLFAAQTTSQPESLVLNEDGTGSLNLRQPDSGVLTCGDLLHTRGDVALLLDLSRLRFDSRIVLFGQPDASTLQLRDVAGDTATFTRATAVGAQCGTFTVNARFDGLPVEPDSRSGLAFDGTSLWYEEDNTGLVFPVNPATGVLGLPVDLGVASQFTHVHAMQGTDFWVHCGCGNNQSIQRRTAAGAVVDTVNTEVDLSEFVAVDAVAFDAAGGVLYVHGFSFDLGVSRLLRVNSNAEPDVLLGAVDFPASLISMTFDGASLWAILGFPPQQVIARIDVNTARATATFAAPDATVEWQGIAAVGSELFLVGRKDRAGVLIGVTP